MDKPCLYPDIVLVFVVSAAGRGSGIYEIVALMPWLHVYKLGVTEYALSTDATI
jgi:hypothetical protein